MRKLFVCLAVTICTLFLNEASAQKLQPVEVKPLHQNVRTVIKPVKPGKWRVPVITWGGDVATIYAGQKGYFKDEGLDVELVAENDFAKQVQMVIDGELVCLRGTMGMINSAAEAFDKAGVELVVVYQLTWSNGGDTLTTRGHIKTPADLKGKTIALQLYGPHMDYVANILSAANLEAGQVSFRWFKELTLPTYDTRGAIVDPVSAFSADSKIDGVMCISPDASALTSGGTKGTGAEGSVKDAHILLTTRTASRVIVDVYAFRKDVFDANRLKVQGFTHALLRAQEGLADLQANKAAERDSYEKLVHQSASLLLGVPTPAANRDGKIPPSTATNDVEGLLADCEFVGFAGNVSFFTGKGTTRNFEKVTDEIQASFIKMGLMGKAVRLTTASWDYTQLARGLKNVEATSVPKFDSAQLGKTIEEKLQAEPESFSTDGTLFQIEINFGPNQATFSAEQYAADYKRALDLSQTYGGAVVLIEGHADPTGIARARQQGKSAAEIAEMEQAIKNLSLTRANAVRKSYLEFCKSKGIPVDESQLLGVGVGVKTPKYPNPKDAIEWAANRRVVFRIRQVEAESSVFQPLGQ